MTFLLSNIESIPENLFGFDNNIFLFNKNVNHIRIIDMIGNTKVINFKPEINISHLKRGVYILQFTYSNEVYNYKFLKE